MRRSRLWCTFVSFQGFEYVVPDHAMIHLRHKTILHELLQHPRTRTRYSVYERHLHHNSTCSSTSDCTSLSSSDNNAQWTTASFEKLQCNVMSCTVASGFHMDRSYMFGPLFKYAKKEGITLVIRTFQEGPDSHVLRVLATSQPSALGRII